MDKKSIFILLLISLIYKTQALDCGVHLRRNEDLTGLINKCLRSNKTLEDLWDMAPISSESSSEERPSIDGKMEMLKSKRSVDNSSVEVETAANQTCIVQCIFENLHMTDTTGYPSHGSILGGLLQNVTNVELKDFLQDTVDGCYHEMDQEATMDPCVYSSKLASCMAEKGKKNCSDWPIGDLPFPE